MQEHIMSKKERGSLCVLLYPISYACRLRDTNNHHHPYIDSTTVLSDVCIDYTLASS